MNTTDPQTGGSLSAKDIWVESIMILVAGAETTSTAMASVIYYLLHNPDSLSTLTAEVRSRFSSVDEITSSRVAHDCKFVRACIDEALRLSPSVVHGPPRQTEAGGIRINGEHFAEGTVLQAPIYTMHRNEKFFPEPDEYRPQRWMAEENEGLTQAQQALVPFHVGPHSWCVARPTQSDDNLLMLSVVLDGDWLSWSSRPLLRGLFTRTTCGWLRRHFAVPPCRWVRGVSIK